MIKITTRPTTNDLLEQVVELSGQSVFACYQCGTCTAGCPFIESMDLYPDKLMRHLMYGLPDVLESNTIWLCASCFLCAERCPRDIDVARVMEALRQMKLRQNEDHTDLAQIPAEQLEGIPQIALVSHLRKNTA
jgi:heterodisulfide reductase subunit C2